MRIDRRRKMPATILLKAMGMSKADILDYFYETEDYSFDGEKLFRTVREEQYRKEDAYAEVTGAGNKVLVKKGQAITKALTAAPTAKK